MKPLFSPLRRRSLPLALAALLSAAAAVQPAVAGTPKDTLVLAAAFDDVITMDPAEAFEISTGEILGNLRPFAAL